MNNGVGWVAKAEEWRSAGHRNLATAPRHTTHTHAHTNSVAHMLCPEHEPQAHVFRKQSRPRTPYKGAVASAPPPTPAPSSAFAAAQPSFLSGARTPNDTPVAAAATTAAAAAWAATSPCQARQHARVIERGAVRESFRARAALAFGCGPVRRRRRHGCVARPRRSNDTRELRD